MDYAAALARVYELGPGGVRLGLDRVQRAADALGAPHQALTAIQVAGTNGKGTVACMLDAGARAAGLRVGLFTSPHLHRFAERIRIDGAEIADDVLAAELAAVLDLTSRKRDPIPLTFFETATLAALGAFRRAGVELAVLEVGLGGRLDATSVVPPLVSVITSIGLDHQEFLGSTIVEIAREKAAIARPGVPLCVGALAPEALAEVERSARLVGAPLAVLGRDFEVGPELRPPWPGEHQRQNAALALAAFGQLTRHDPRLTPESFVEALPSARWPGRYEEISSAPGVLLDGAHNLEAVAALVAALAERRARPTTLLFGTVEGKPAGPMLELLAPLVEEIVLAPPPLPRAFDPAPLGARFGAAVAPDVVAGLSLARRLAEDRSGEPGLILVTGSLFLVGEVRRILLDEPADPPIRL